MKQRTIKKSIHCAGIGLHSGRKVELLLQPAAEDTGIVFCLQGENGVKLFSPSPNAVAFDGPAAALTHNGSAVATVEHLLAAIRGLEIDNIRISVQGGEVPIMDGSAASFVFLLRSAGLETQSRPRRALMLKRPFAMERDGQIIKASPYAGIHLDYTLDHAHPMIGLQSMCVDITPEIFIDKLARARTFEFMSDVENMQHQGFALGGSLYNSVFLDDYKALNPDGLRFKDEFVRHRMLDFLGDMALLDLPVFGRFEIHCSGHSLNKSFFQALHDNRDIYLEETVLSDKVLDQTRTLPGDVREAAGCAASF